MSCYGQERGHVVIKKTAVSAMRKKMVKIMNERADKDYAAVLDVYEQFKSSPPKDRREVVTERLHKMLSTHSTLHSSHIPEAKLQVTGSWEAVRELFRGESKSRIYKPRRSAFPKYKSTDATFSIDELRVTFDAKEGRVDWDVEDNNRSVDRAHESFLGSTVMKLLNDHEYGRNEGGYFKYEDEYDREHMSGPRISHWFGPLGMLAAEDPCGCHYRRGKKPRGYFERYQKRVRDARRMHQSYSRYAF